MRAALLEASTYALSGRDEPVIAQALLEFTVVPRRPYRERAFVAQRGIRRGHAGIVVEPLIGLAGKCTWAIVHVEQDSVNTTSFRSMRTRRSLSGCPANGLKGPRFHSTTAGTNSATVTRASPGSMSNAARKVNPIPSPPTSTRGRSAVRKWRHPTIASASSEPCMRLDINVLPFNSTTYSSSRFVSRMSFPSGVHVLPINAQAFTLLGYSVRNAGRRHNDVPFRPGCNRS
jgi:hypothetical protein